MKRIAIFNAMVVFLIAGPLTLAGADSSTGTWVTESGFSATRGNVGATTQWTYETGDISYRVVVGQIFIGSDSLVPPALITSGKKVLEFKTSNGITALRLLYAPNNINNQSVGNKWFLSATFKHIGDRDQFLFLLRQTVNGPTFDFRPLTNRDGSLIGRTLKMACYVSAWGLPLANGILSASNIALSVISNSNSSAGELAKAGSQLLSKIYIPTTFDSNGKITVEPTFSFLLDSTGLSASAIQDRLKDIKAHGVLIGVGDGIKQQATFVAYNQITHIVKVNVKETIDQVSGLMNTIINAPGFAKSTNQVCNSLN